LALIERERTREINIDPVIIKKLFNIIGSNLVFNIIEYFSFINLFLLFLFIIISLFFILINSTLLYYSNVSFNHCLVEFISTLFSLLFLVIIISPALIILLDFDLIILPSFIIYSLGLQWAWQFNIIFLPINIGFDSYCDHYIISSINKKSLFYCNVIKSSYNLSINALSSYSLIIRPFLEQIRPFSLYDLYIKKLLIINYIGSYNILPANILLDRLLGASLYNDDFIAIRLKTKKWLNIEKSNEKAIIYSYLFDISQYILLPIYSFIRLFVYSFDVIHTLGFYSWGIKIDAIPGRINLGTTLRLLWKGEYRGKCFELCGQGHLSMLLLSIVV